jgi:hypothetical protein
MRMMFGVAGFPLVATPDIPFGENRKRKRAARLEDG